MPKRCGPIDSIASNPPDTMPRITLLAAILGLVTGAAARADEETSANWWSLVPLAEVSIPRIDDPWIRTPVDAFVLAKLREQGLAPSAEADRRTLIRRLSYDLHGLPPAPEEIDAFLTDTSDDAFGDLVDRLLGSPRYGERWGRYWLDVVHFGESHGYDKDKPRPNAWPYRDYVIDSLNRDKPYDRFVAEQVAGDVLYPDDPRLIAATGFIAAGPWDFVGHAELREDTVDKDIARSNDRDDMVANTMSTFLSLTVHCARCHDHKFDPIRQEDYYALQAVFAGVDRADRPYGLELQIAPQRFALAKERFGLEDPPVAVLKRMAEITSPEIQALDAQMGENRSAIKALGTNDASPARDKLEHEYKSLMDKRAKLAETMLDDDTRAELVRFREAKADVESRIVVLFKPQLVYAAASQFAPQGSFKPPDGPRLIYLLARGDVRSPQGQVTPAGVACVQGPASQFALSLLTDEGQRRAALARWLTDPRNALLRRSIVNRVWQYHFGQGIVDTPNDFGRMGSPPSHPELLEWLAGWFIENGHSLKKLHRLLVTSSVYRQTSQSKADSVRLDSSNRYLWRANRQRLDAESIRDAMLAVSGKLDLTMGGPSVQQFLFKDDHSPVYDYTRFDVDDPRSLRRSIYRFLVRSVPDPFMECLDCADPSIMTPKRNTTLTSIQALALLNNPLATRQAEHFAERLRAIAPDAPRQIEAAYRLALGRKPGEREAQALVEYAERHGLANACRVIFNSNEFVFID